MPLTKGKARAKLRMIMKTRMTPVNMPVVGVTMKVAGAELSMVRVTIGLELPTRPTSFTARKKKLWVPSGIEARLEWGLESFSFFGSCPDCGAAQLAYEEGCVKCHGCGFSQC